MTELPRDDEHHPGERCGNCRFWTPASGDLAQVKVEEASNVPGGVCLRFPPVILRPPPEWGGTEENRGYWPETFSRQWCGEWQAKPVAPLPPGLTADTPFDPPAPWFRVGLTHRTRKCLLRLGVSTPRDLAAKTSADVLEAKGVGRTTLAEFRELLARFGLTFADG